MLDVLAPRTSRVRVWKKAAPSEARFFVGAPAPTPAFFGSAESDGLALKLTTSSAAIKSVRALGRGL
ncbi:MAG TPA: hypothetical protein VFT72_10005 [Opitutaceae bacterium]|nr:hypothetical protein [Opitutaceae bacterium]